MSASTYEQLRNHIGHTIECVEYGGGDNIAVECVDCCEVLLDFDAPEEGEGMPTGVIKPQSALTLPLSADQIEDIVQKQAITLWV